ncbi:EpsG family protein [Marinomonas gallaica]|uniref:EpsG family protein n=1 Tax=Marinomonas gallaica TaxID=1806667 RepID=UPI003A931E90
MIFYLFLYIAALFVGGSSLFKGAEKKFVISLIFLMFIICVFSFRYNVGYDWNNYLNIFNNQGNYRLERVYIYVVDYISYRWFIVLTSFIQLFGLFLLARASKCNLATFFCLYVISSNFFEYISPLRQSLAMGIIFIALATMFTHVYMSFIIRIASVFFHSSTILFVFVKLYGKLKVSPLIKILIPILLYLFGGLFIGLLFDALSYIPILNLYSGYITNARFGLENSGSGMAILVELVLSLVIYYLCLAYSKFKEEKYYDVLSGLSFLYLIIIPLTEHVVIFTRVKFIFQTFFLLFVCLSFKKLSYKRFWDVIFLCVSIILFTFYTFKYFSFILGTSGFIPFSLSIH